MISYISKLQGIEQIKSDSSPEEIISLYTKASEWYIQEFEKFKNQFQSKEEFEEFQKELQSFNAFRSGGQV